MKKRHELIGKIILSDVLEWGTKRFLSFVIDVEASSHYRRLSQDRVVVPNVPTNVLQQDEAVDLAESGVIARVSNDLAIHYAARELCVEYEVNSEELTRYLDAVSSTVGQEVNRLLNKMRRISTRNRIVRSIVEGIVEHQKAYFGSGNELHLKPFSRADLARAISDGWRLDFVIDVSRISRAVQGLSLVTPWGEDVCLKSFFVTKRDMVRRCVKELVGMEKRNLAEGLIMVPYTDEELRRRVYEEFGLSVTRREVTYCRKGLGILPHLGRNGYVYHTLAANFSQLYPFTAWSVASNAPDAPGVYELSLDSGGIDYPGGHCQTFYIGSARSLRRRLLGHLSSSSKNGGIKGLLSEKSCLFRYLSVPVRWPDEETRFYNLFVSTYGGPPLCNRIRPRVTATE